mgnify:CR=1 FL=1
MKAAHLKAPVLPTVKQIITANAAFEQALFAKSLCHAGQPSLVQVASNCEKRAIGTNGGFGYRSLTEGGHIELLDSIILACWQCSEARRNAASAPAINYAEAGPPPCFYMHLSEWRFSHGRI